MRRKTCLLPPPWYESEESALTEELPGYAGMYPDLYMDQPSVVRTEGKIAYLTFDDGPSSLTPQILDVLQKYEIPATFFIVTEGEKDLQILNRIVEEGHAIGIHSDRHEYRSIYGSVEEYLDDFSAAYRKIEQACGVRPQIFRFPGGSVNSYNLGQYQEIVSEMLRRGFRYYDWNVSTQDAHPRMTAEQIYANVVRDINTYQCERAVILAHDSAYQQQTLEALPNIIEYLSEQGYTFARLDAGVEPVVFAYSE